MFNPPPAHGNTDSPGPDDISLSNAGVDENVGAGTVVASSGLPIRMRAARSRMRSRPETGQSTPTTASSQL